jgi:hypothetical protein
MKKEKNKGNKRKDKERIPLLKAGHFFTSLTLNKKRKIQGFRGPL